MTKNLNRPFTDIARNLLQIYALHNRPSHLNCVAALCRKAGSSSKHN